MALQYYRKHFYITYKNRCDNSGKYPHDIILKRLISYEVAQKYINEFFSYFCNENSLAIKSWTDPILITNDIRLYKQFRNVFSQDEFEKYCLVDNKATFETYEHFIKIAEGRYNTVEMYSKSENWTDDDGNTYNSEIENGWRTSTQMIKNNILIKELERDDEFYKDDLNDLIKINDYHYEWWESLDDNWIKYFTYLTTSGVFGGIPTPKALADLLTLEELRYYFENNQYFEQLRSISPLSQFQYLKTLNLKHNRIVNLIPLKNIKSLESLNIENNFIESLLPLQNLPKLYDLNASSNRINYYDTIPTIKKLIINSNSIKELLNISKSTNIEHLEINNNNISDLTELSMLKNLKHLSIKGNKITDIEPLSCLQNLEVLKLDNNQLETIEPLKKIKSLTELSFNNNTVNDLTPISRLGGLKILSCGGNQISYGEALTVSSKLGCTLSFW